MMWKSSEKRTMSAMLRYDNRSVGLKLKAKMNTSPISLGSIFAVVFATMIYSTRKLKKDNPIDALKNEDL